MRIGLAFDAVLDAAKAGSDWAWATFYREISGPVTGFFRARGLDDPEDAAGDVFFEVARNIDHFSGTEDAFRVFVFSIAYRRLLVEKETKSQHPARSLLADRVLDRLRSDPYDPSLVPDEATLQEVRRAFEAVTPEQRDILALRVVGGLSVEQTAAVLSLGVKFVRTAQRRALTRIRRVVPMELAVS